MIFFLFFLILVFSFSLLRLLVVRERKRENKIICRENIPLDPYSLSSKLYISQFTSFTSVQVGISSNYQL